MAVGRDRCRQRREAHEVRALRHDALPGLHAIGDLDEIARSRAEQSGDGRDAADKSPGFFGRLFTL